LLSNLIKQFILDPGFVLPCSFPYGKEIKRPYSFGTLIIYYIEDKGFLYYYYYRFLLNKII